MPHCVLLRWRAYFDEQKADRSSIETGPIIDCFRRFPRTLLALEVKTWQRNWYCVKCLPHCQSRSHKAKKKRKKTAPSCELWRGKTSALTNWTTVVNGFWHSLASLFIANLSSPLLWPRTYYVISREHFSTLKHLRARHTAPPSVVSHVTQSHTRAILSYRFDPWQCWLQNCSCVGSAVQWVFFSIIVLLFIWSINNHFWSMTTFAVQIHNF